MTANYSDLMPGTPIVWKNTGVGSLAMNLKNLANAGIREGAKSASLIDGSYGMPEVLVITVETKLQVAPTAGLTLDAYIGFSSSATAGTDNPGGLTGADAAVGNADQLPQLTFAGSLNLSNALGTGVQRKVVGVVRPTKAYMIPVLRNASGQSTTNVDGETIYTVTPMYRRTPIA